MTWQTMTAKQLAEKLDGREYLNEITPEEENEAYCNRLVAVFGYSDDCMEFAGYLDDEIGAFNGVKVCVEFNEGVVQEGEGCRENMIEAVWCDDKAKAAWTFKTDIPHETFNIYEDGELFCVGIVFCMDDLV